MIKQLFLLQKEEGEKQQESHTRIACIGFPMSLPRPQIIFMSGTGLKGGGFRTKSKLRFEVCDPVFSMCTFVPQIKNGLKSEQKKTYKAALFRLSMREASTCE